MFFRNRIHYARVLYLQLTALALVGPSTAFYLLLPSRGSQKPEGYYSKGGGSSEVATPHPLPSLSTLFLPSL